MIADEGAAFFFIFMKIGTSLEGTWSPGLVAGTSPFVCADLNKIFWSMDSHTNPMEAILRERLSAHYFVRQTRCVVSGLSNSS